MNGVDGSKGLSAEGDGVGNESRRRSVAARGYARMVLELALILKLDSLLHPLPLFRHLSVDYRRGDRAVLNVSLLLQTVTHFNVQHPTASFLVESDPQIPIDLTLFVIWHPPLAIGTIL